MNNLHTWPTAIYLQHSEDGYPVPVYKYETDGITWSESPVFDCDIEYVRADLAADLPVLLEALQEARNGLIWYQEMNPAAVSECDAEAMERIDVAIARATGGQP